jgi:hypothetical protein
VRKHLEALKAAAKVEVAGATDAAASAPASAAAK